MFTFDISPDGANKFRVTAKSRDVAVWERTYKGVSLGKLQSDPTITDLEGLAHLTAKRRKLFEGNLAEFRETCDFLPVEDDDDEAEADPTQPAR